MKAVWVAAFQGCPAKCEFSKEISGTIFAGVRGDVVMKMVFPVTLAMIHHFVKNQFTLFSGGGARIICNDNMRRL